MMYLSSVLLSSLLSFWVIHPAFSFAPRPTPVVLAQRHQKSFSPSTAKTAKTTRTSTKTSTTTLAFFDKVFEEEGPLGKGITIGKVQVALFTTDRSRDSIFGAVKRAVDEHAGVSTNYDLACLAQEVCLALLRRKDSWTAASSESKWFKEDDSGKAESLFNDWANREAVKFEKEYPATITGDKDEAGFATAVVVSIILELVGDQTRFAGAGLSLAQTEDVLQSIASDAMVEDGDCVNAVEVFWTPGESTEVLSSRDLIVDFPELITI
mmetsp:Transcript_1382/g.1863  ORF Transcript_1382/g.1863 Transcript_1382/m.1863 type:complete len:267 (+) Transcript_1382:82-882(+)|eukprot:CAMPEP_0198143354 /NCGR_PEP_ID=MMETSP1443-20131203/6664_1 /TAXON_ID=186043 /ORGANISM="Entomoneis sp., Strain CCMP2396" /LENGTH=266 /DNA_ID=CAMNT_0043806579 /DNA_START=72 /DNA_END=872 /DNA_ORIENTATION=+